MGKADGGLRAKLHRSVPGYWTAVESGHTAAGIPDSEVCFRGGVTAWVESKTRRSREGKVRFRPGQVLWLTRRARMGGRCFVLVQGEEDVALYLGADAGSLALGLRVEPLGRWPRVRVDWAEVGELIRGRSAPALAGRAP